MDERAQRCIERLIKEIDYYEDMKNEAENISEVDECLQSIEICGRAISIIREEFADNSKPRTMTVCGDRCGKP